MVKLSYIEIIQDALVTLKEPKGSSRQALWKCIESKHPEEANRKQFFIRLKKLSADSLNNIEQHGARFKLSKSYQDKIKRRLAGGADLKTVIKTQAMIKPVKKLAKKAKKVKTAKKAADKGKKAAKPRKSGQKAAGKPKGKKSEGAAKSTKQAM